jgi:hypothetical protein
MFFKRLEEIKMRELLNEEDLNQEEKRIHSQMLEGLADLLYKTQKKAAKIAAKKVMSESSLRYTSTTDVLDLVVMRGYQKCVGLPDLPEAGATPEMRAANLDVMKFVNYFVQEMNKNKQRQTYKGSALEIVSQERPNQYA